METIKNIAVCFIISLGLYMFSNFIQSEYLMKFIEQNLILMLVALLAINSATIGMILGKIKEICDKYDGADFSQTAKQLKISIIEQVVLIVTGTIFLILKGSQIIQEINTILKILDIGLITITVYSIYILYDTANAVFVIVDYDKD